MKSSSLFSKFTGNNCFRKTILIITILIFITSGSMAQVSVVSSGNVKIASDLNINPYITTCQIYPDETNSAYLGITGKQFLEVRGQYHYATTTLLTSDMRLKKNFRNIDDPLVKLLKLSGKKYDFIPESSDTIGTDEEKKKKEQLKKDKLGFVAQEVEQVLPEAVFYDKTNDSYYIDYNAVIPVIVEAMKEQQNVIEDLKTEIRSLKEKANEKSATIGSDDSDPALLFQNIPNPFTVTTRIEMFLPKGVLSATLYLYNMQGEQIMQIPVIERGKTSVIIDGYSFKAGMYLYSLIANGKEVDTKKMILTK